ncbi:MAG: M20 family metallopeptidase [Actinomycetota bacterium]|nr:M20 family metallopeptidase [Actinomycetota bacterium]
MSSATHDSDVEALKQAVCARVDELADQLIDASHQIHAHPELNYEEVFAHDLLTDLLERHDVAPVRHAYDVGTAFDAGAGAEGPTIAVLCEYDALPGVGHACGHNIIATAGLGAGLAAAFVAEAAGGRVRIMGTPAEEGGGGKVRMARKGAFDDIDAAMMVHPADADLIAMDCIAIQELMVTYHGKSAHASAAPWEGRNALDAAVLGYTSLAQMRQHIRPNERIHGIFTKAGDKPNIVPSEAAMDWYVRSATISSLQPLKQRVFTALESAATACGCTMTHEWVDNTYADMIDNGPMVASYVANAARIGRSVLDPATSGKRVMGSTDMGNVSYLVPSIHPMIKVAPDGVPIHSVEFAEWAASADGDQAVLDGAKAMAMTVVDLWSSAELRERIQSAFATRPAGVQVL